MPSASAIGTPSGTGTASEVPPSGAPAAADGPAADARIEAEFVANHPGDLSAQDAAQVRELAVRVWTAETTGEGREQFPSYFPPAGTPLRPYTQVRMQAFSAHTAEGRVIVQLLWAGADPSGAYQDRRPGMLAVTRTATGWEPVR
ncbi:hypothetical protein ACIQF6_28715 [Kitasatospora sp. NPDC092948]|uniref:hypothetical protein n=1 Tax=Kitasatospora sp. NPDC092948 TaxID=3364088 RepID=UPI00380CF99A